MSLRRVAALSALLIAVGGLAACAPEPGPAPTAGISPSGSASSEATPVATATPGTTATAEPGAVALPTDCRAILSPGVLAELGSTPLNDPAMGPSGVQSDGTLVCVWRDPGADTTGLVTTVSRMSRGPALDMLNALADDEGFTCYTPDDGTRCENTFPNPQYPVTDGRTLYWRDGVLIDTVWSNLAPSGYTESIVSAIF